jgi:succinoglycan biosynthesis protein ExoM
MSASETPTRTDCSDAPILIAVVTAHRERELERLLITLSSDYGSRPNVALLVVDNSPDRGSYPVFQQCTHSFGARASYAHEPQRGYSSARNAVLCLAGAVDIAMIDDDEVPGPGWLDGLLEARERSGANVVAGPVVTVLPEGAPDWYRASGVFTLEAPDYPEGTDMPFCAANNTLVSATALALVPEGFDPRFDIHGGEDSYYFFQARLRGAHIAWTRSAPVYEHVTRDRLRVGWIFRRAARTGHTRAMIEMETGWVVRARARRTAKATGLVGLALVNAVGAVIRRDRGLGLRAVHRVGLAYGMWRALLGSASWCL